MHCLTATTSPGKYTKAWRITQFFATTAAVHHQGSPFVGPGILVGRWKPHGPDQKDLDGMVEEEGLHGDPQVGGRRGGEASRVHGGPRGALDGMKKI